MITMMIVDDEAVIRRGILTAIDWRSLGVEIVGEAANGRDGLAKILIAKPDVVIADIKMPVMDGINMAREVKKKLPLTRIVILSGYSDFEYSRRALKVGVVDYLLKPVSVDDLVSLMKRLTGEIEEERKHQKEMALGNRLLSKNLPIIRANCINEFAEGKITEEQFIDRAEGAVDIDLSGPLYQIVVIDIDDSQSESLIGDRQLLRYSLANITEEILGSETSATIGYAREDSLLVLLNTEAQMDEIVEYCRQIQFYVTQYFKITITVGLGPQVNSIAEIRNSYRQAWDAVNNKIYKGKNRVILPDEVVAPSQALLVLQQQDETELREDIRLLKKLDLQKKLDSIFEKYFAGRYYPRKVAEQFCIYLINIPLQELEKEQIDFESAFVEGINLYEDIEKFETLDEIALWVKNVFSRALQALDGQHSNQYKSIVKNGMEFAQRHYTENIQVTDVAGAVFVTPNYFSKIFKQETGENFTEWLNKFRIEKAKARILGEPEAKTYQIASEAGFKDYKYFAYIFKKYTGYTPGTYRQLLRK
jgi:Response regulator containing CheY-like receiver domain and AraC-type DNA-binding domain